jgi:hypothetical protein
MPQTQLPVTVLTRTVTGQNRMIYYPQVANLANQQAETQINRILFQTVQGLIRDQQNVQVPGDTRMEGSYEIKNNQRGIFSTTLSNYAYTPRMAHGMSFLGSVTANVNTGTIYTLRSLFKPGSNFVEVISRNIREQIRRRQIPTLREFTTISPEQDFYVADKTLVIFFQLYEITPYYVGFPMFPISVYDLEPVIDENGPLGILAAD